MIGIDHLAGYIGVAQRMRWLVSPFVSNALTFLGQSWPAYALALALIPMRQYPKARKRTRVTSQTAVCIEGAPGSGNSYFVNAFGLANPDLRLAHHHHVASQVTRAVRLGIPTIVLLRNPHDSVTSRASRDPNWIGALFRQWLRIYRAVDACGSAVVIGRFETVMANPADFVRHVNRRLGTAFSDELPDPEVVFRALDHSFSALVGAPRRNPNRPCPERERRKGEVRPRVVTHALAPAALALHDRLASRAW